MNAVAPLIPCIVSGGSGTRLWPVSRESMPKPFMRLADDQACCRRPSCVSPGCRTSPACSR